jgi:CheY-like chemotaxis protein
MARTSNGRILVADDSKLWQRMVREMLMEAGFEVHLASDGRECVQKVKYELQDLSLVLLDIRMPELDGFAVLKELKRGQLTASIPILAISSHYRDAHVQELKKLGAVGYLNKALPLGEILFRINRILYPEKRELRSNPRVVDNILVRYRRTISPPPEKTEMRLSFHLPRKGRSIRSRGTVVWRNEYQPEGLTNYPPGVGVKFMNLEQEDRLAITDHVLSRLT